jgi:hypothetical protein
LIKAYAFIGLLAVAFLFISTLKCGKEFSGICINFETAGFPKETIAGFFHHVQQQDYEQVARALKHARELYGAGPVWRHFIEVMSSAVETQHKNQALLSSENSGHNVRNNESDIESYVGIAKRMARRKKADR